MSPIAATDAELADAAIKAAWNDPSTSPEVSFERCFGDAQRVRAIVVDGPVIDDLILLARTGEEVNFDIVWFIDGLDEPIEKTSFTAPLNSVEWSIKHNHTVVRTDDCDFVYYPERIGEIFRHDEGIVPEALQSYGDYLPVPRDGRDD